MASRANRSHCKRCERERAEGERFSYRGICRDCAIAAIEAQYASAPRQVGDPEWRLRYRRGVAASVGAILLEDLED